MACVTQDDTIGNGRATIQFSSSRTEDTAYDTKTYETYSFNASPASGWRFSHWEYAKSYRTVDKRGTHDTGWRLLGGWIFDNDLEAVGTKELLACVEDTDSTLFFFEITYYEYRYRACFESISTGELLYAPTSGALLSGRSDTLIYL